jgi:Ca-activated chloride channel family protein
MSAFQLDHPVFLLLLLLLPLLAWYMAKKSPQASLQFPNIDVLKQIQRSRRSPAGMRLIALRLCGLFLLILALARPQWVKQTSNTQVEGIDIVVTLDLSGSMCALDLSTQDRIVTRLDAAKLVVQDFIRKRPYDRISMIVFASESYVVSPLTLNHTWLEKNVQRLELGSIDGSGTAIGTALGAGVNRLRDSPDRNSIIILLTDGENNSGDLAPLGAAEAANSYGVKVYTIATGREGRVPVPQMSRDGRVMRDQSGQPIYRGESSLSNYDEDELAAIAELTGGQFYRATEPGDLERIYETIDLLEKTEIELENYAEFHEYYMWPALFGFILLIVEQGLHHTRYRRLP